MVSKTCAPAEYDGADVSPLLKFSADPRFIQTCISRGVIKEYNLDKGTERTIVSSSSERYLFLEGNGDDVYYTKLKPDTRIDWYYPIVEGGVRTEGLWVYNQKSNVHTKILDGGNHSFKVFGEWGVLMTNYSNLRYSPPLTLSITNLRTGEIKVQNRVVASMGFFSNPNKEGVLSWD